MSLPPTVQLDQADLDLAMIINLQEEEMANFGLFRTVESESGDDDNNESNALDSSNDNNEYEYFEGHMFDAELRLLEEEENNDNEEMEDEIDLAELSYEELIVLGEIIGVEKRGLSSNEIDSSLLPYKFMLVEGRIEIDRCVICQVEFEEEENLVALHLCKHSYHLECIRKWLQIKKNCPICSTEVTALKNNA